MKRNTVSAILSKLGRVFIAPFPHIIGYIRLKLKWHGVVRFTSKADIAAGACFEGSNSIGDRSYFNGSMGYGSYVCNECWLDADVGRFCSIGHQVRTAGGTHPISAPFATTSPMFFSLRKQAMETFAREQRFDEILPRVQIGNDCWIGDRVEIVGGKTIGDGAVVLTGAMVTKDVPSYAVVGGVPAQVLKYRYDEETIAWLLKVRWWDKPVEWLSENWELLGDIEKLKEALNES